MRKLSEIKREYDTLAREFIESNNKDNIISLMKKLDQEMLDIKKKYPYGGVCEDCGKETEEYCHDNRCLDCCRKYNELFESYYE